MKIKLCNVHKLAVANEGENRKPIHIPFGTWEYDSNITQTFDREHAENIADVLAKHIALGEPGIPVYQGHPDVPEYAGKYPDKGALGWVKKMVVNEDGVDCEVEWDRDPGKGFAWFSPYWVGDDPSVGPDGKRNVIIDGINSIGLVNNPNIHEFRLANESGENLTRRGGEAGVAAFKLPDHLLALAKRFDDRMALANVIDANGAGHGADGKFDGSGSGGGSGGTPKGLTFKDSEGQLNSVEHSYKNYKATGIAAMRSKASRGEKAKAINGLIDFTRKERKEAKGGFKELFGTEESGDDALRRRRSGRAEVKALHAAAISAGLKYNRATHLYE